MQLEAINLNYKNLIVTTILENIHLLTELLISGIVYQIMLWRLTLLMHLRIVLINTGLIIYYVVYDYKSDLTGTGGLYLFVLNVLFEMRAERISCTRTITLDWTGSEVKGSFFGNSAHLALYPYPLKAG